ncbi:MAG: hypothetical protein JXR37_18400 [Kiritimatiellae bacterium]|nr:hypothetical protein [Kiritimatiellia bacterium]
MTGRPTVQLITVATRSHLPGVAVLAESLRRHHPQQRLTCYLVERAAEPADACDGLVDIVPVSDLDLPGGPAFLFQYTPFELCCAVKPFALLHQLARAGVEGAVYLDGDMYACAPFLDAVREAWAAAPVLLTPHVHCPGQDIDFRYFARSGGFNAGFVAVAKSEAATAMLSWWKARLARDCYYDLLGGVFVDQKWLELAAALFPCVRAWGHRGVNVGHWNIHECTFAEENGRTTVAPGVPLCLFHFSRFTNPGLTEHESVLRDIPPQVQQLADRYARELRARRPPGAAVPPCSFSTFDDGTPIPAETRELVRQRKVRVENPFARKDEVLAALEAEGLESVVESRVELRVGYFTTQYRALRRRVAELEPRLWRAENRLQRLDRHPVFGPLLRLWNRFVNSDLWGGPEA